MYLLVCVSLFMMPAYQYAAARDGKAEVSVAAQAAPMGSRIGWLLHSHSMDALARAVDARVDDVLDVSADFSAAAVLAKNSFFHVQLCVPYVSTKVGSFDPSGGHRGICFEPGKNSSALMRYTVAGANVSIDYFNVDKAEGYDSPTCSIGLWHYGDWRSEVRRDNRIAQLKHAEYVKTNRGKALLLKKSFDGDKRFSHQELVILEVLTALRFDRKHSHVQLSSPDWKTYQELLPKLTEPQRASLTCLLDIKQQ